jgi:hypothetical protein
MNDDLEKLGVIGNRYMRQTFEKKEFVERKYSKSSIPIGLRRNGSIYRIDLKDAIRALIVGTAGSGKTFKIRGWGDRMKKAGYAILYLTDVKNEFFSSRKPVQEKFRKLLLEGEQAQGMNIITLRPTFFKQIDKKLAPHNVWFSPKLSEISKADFTTLMRAHELALVQRTALELLYEELRKEKDLEDIGVEDLERYLDVLDPELVQSATKNSMKMKMRPLQTSHFIEQENAKNIVNAMKDREDEEGNIIQGHAVAVNMENFDSFGRNVFAYHEVTLSVIFRQVIHARRKKEIPPLVVFFDEMSRFVHADRMTSIREQVEESVDLDRRYGVSEIFISQEIDKVPERITKQCRYWFVPFTADTNTIQKVLTDAGQVRNPQTAKTTALRWKKRLGKHDWLAVDRVASTVEIIRPLGPLSWHEETAS